jgi:hypothetical protein
MPSREISGKEQTEQSHRISRGDKFLPQIASLKLKIVKTGNKIQSNMLNDCGRNSKAGKPTYREILL